jgi:hypothetical protein
LGATGAAKHQEESDDTEGQRQYHHYEIVCHVPSVVTAEALRGYISPCDLHAPKVKSPYDHVPEAKLNEHSRVVK